MGIPLRALRRLTITMSKKFKLRWNDFHENVSKSFGLLKNEDYLYDVTLVSDDNLQISAHKLVLSACSEYFKNIFKNNKNPYHHPLVCLSGVSSEDLNSIIDYMYNGEVNIYQEELDRFLNVAQRLKLEGLMENEAINPAGPEKSDFKFQEYQFPLDNTYAYNTEMHSASESKNILASFEEVGSIFMNSDDIDKINDKIEEYITWDDQGIYNCTYCGKIGDKYKSHIKNHIETHLEGLSFPCKLCDKTFRSRNYLAQHNSRIHRPN